jgi:hypothetical protein
MNRILSRFIAIALLLGLWTALPSFPQRNNAAYLSYIERYKDVAVAQMLHYRIPASITLAQGLLESGAGLSPLATQSNNHFGIKCGGTWTGPTTYKDDDAQGECFRKYKDPMESYEDHSLFLVNRQRYAPLFALSPKDYRGWAQGLKQAGYATNPAYAQNLINIIEQYNLDRFDDFALGQQAPFQPSRPGFIPVGPQSGWEHTIFKNNNNYYLVARDGDTFKQIAAETGVSVRKLIRYNELYKDYVLRQGDIIYMEKKHRKAERVYRNHPHIVNAGESLYTISQEYGIRLKYLYRMNHLDKEYMPKAGDVLRVR